MSFIPCALAVLIQPVFLPKIKAGQVGLAHLDFSGFTEIPFYKGLRMADHILAFLALDEEGMLPALQGICYEIMQAIGDQKVLFSTHYFSLLIGLLATGTLRESRAHRWRNIEISEKPGQMAQRFSLQTIAQRRHHSVILVGSAVSKRHSVSTRPQRMLEAEPLAVTLLQTSSRRKICRFVRPEAHKRPSAPRSARSALRVQRQRYGRRRHSIRLQVQ